MEIKEILKKYFELIEKENIEIKIKDNHDKSSNSLSPSEIIELLNIRKAIKENIKNLSKEELFSLYKDPYLIGDIEAELSKRQTLN